MLKAEVLITHFLFHHTFHDSKQSIRRPVVEPKFVMQSHNHRGLLCLQHIPMGDVIQSSKQSLFMPKKNGSSKRTWFQKTASSTIFNLETEYNIVTHFSQKHSIFNAFPFYPNTKRQKLMAFLVEWRNWSNHSARKKPYLAKLQKDLFT